ncbi:MAG: rRNA maturation RNase YbeY [Campylobacterota bacterium]|nr:rRNA maturation RNase YbeY [Campylobacterota bacterium]
MFNIVFENNTDHEINLDFLEEILNDIASKEIEFILTTNNEIQEINLTNRGIDKPTDVLSFPYLDMPNAPLGSIVISADFVEKKSKEYKHSFNDELTLLFIHGLLHLLGYDHEVDNGEHRSKEVELIAKYKLPKSLIVRVCEE